MSNNTNPEYPLLPSLLAHSEFRAAQVEALRLEIASLNQLLDTLNAHGFTTVSEFPFIYSPPPETKVDKAVAALRSIATRAEAAWHERTLLELLPPQHAEHELRRQITDRLRQCEQEIVIARELERKALLFIFAATNDPSIKRILAEGRVKARKAEYLDALATLESKKAELRRINEAINRAKDEHRAAGGSTKSQRIQLLTMHSHLDEAKKGFALAKASADHLERSLVIAQAQLDALSDPPPKEES